MAKLDVSAVPGLANHNQTTKSTRNLAGGRAKESDDRTHPSNDRIHPSNDRIHPSNGVSGHGSSGQDINSHTLSVDPSTHRLSAGMDLRILYYSLIHCNKHF